MAKNRQNFDLTMWYRRTAYLKWISSAKILNIEFSRKNVSSKIMFDIFKYEKFISIESLTECRIVRMKTGWFTYKYVTRKTRKTDTETNSEASWKIT